MNGYLVSVRTLHVDIPLTVCASMKEAEDFRISLEVGWIIDTVRRIYPPNMVNSLETFLNQHGFQNEWVIIYPFVNGEMQRVPDEEGNELFHYLNAQQ